MFCSGTSSVYSVYTHAQYRYLSVRSFIPFLCRGSPKLHKSSVPSDFPVLALCVEDCIEDVAEWMGDSKLMMNDDKAECMAIGTRSELSKVIPNLTPITIFGCDKPFSQFVRNLGFYLDETLSTDAHTKYLCHILFCQLRRIEKSTFLSTCAANKLAVSLILCRLDYCNSLHVDIPDSKRKKFQRIQNHAA